MLLLIALHMTLTDLLPSSDTVLSLVSTSFLLLLFHLIDFSGTDPQCRLKKHQLEQRVLIVTHSSSI